MKLFISALLCLLSIVAFSRIKPNGSSGYSLPEGITDQDIYPDVILIKEKNEYRGILSGAPYQAQSYFQTVTHEISGFQATRLFPNHKALQVKKANDKRVDLSRVYSVQISPDGDLIEAINILMNTGFFEYVEPKFKDHLLYTPNDPSISQQYYLELVKAYEAWDISQGDTNVVIGITDTGIQLNHADLQNKIKYNYDDPINGTDDDGDGYVDNYYGWDLGDNDNNPTTQASHHGIWVSGVAGMEADNNHQGAGIGFNCKLLPVKIQAADGSLPGSYEGIVYAADHGADIINCSWGSANSFSQFGQDIISYATFNQNALVVCAAGNTGTEVKYYPASFKYALSVALTDSLDVVTDITSYHHLIDLCAPGATMNTSKQNNGFGNIGGGSSFASPVVAACAAVLKSHDPSLSALQLGEHLKVHSDIIDTLIENQPFAGKLGYGRVNLFKALTESGKPSIVLTNKSLSQTVLFDGDTIDFVGEFTNYLDPSSSGLEVVLRSNSPYVEIIDSTATLGVINTMGNKSNSSQPFKFRIIPGADNNTTVSLTRHYSDGSYFGHDYFMLIINSDYADLDVNDLLVTATSNGRIGYSQNAQNQGSGIAYQGGNSFLYQMGLLVAQADDQVSFSLEDEFEKTDSLDIVSPGRESDKDITTYYSDENIGSNSLHLAIKQKMLGWNKSGHNNYVITEFNINNTGGSDLNNIYPAVYADWDVEQWNNNIAYYDHERQMGVIYNPGGSYTGIKLLTDTNKAHFYAFNNDGADGSYVLYDGYSQAEQYNTASGGIQRATANAGDLSETIGVGPLAIGQGDSVRFAIAIIAGNDSASLAVAADSAAAQYYEIRHVDLELSSINNLSCFGANDGSASVEANAGVPPYNFLWNDPSGQAGSMATNLSNGQYQVTVTDYVGNTKTTSLIINQPDSLTASVDTIYQTLCYGDCNGGAVIDVSGGSLGYSYDWSDSTIGNTSAPALCAGTYSVIVSDQNNCSDTLTVTVTQPDSLILSIADTIAATHPDTCNGFMEVEATGGIEPYYYYWTGGNFNDTSSVGNVCPDNYIAFVQDANGCQTSKSVEIRLDYEAPEPNSSSNLIAMNAIYPNPTSSLLLIEWVRQDGTFTLHDITGKKLTNGLLQKGINQLDMSRYASGNYFLTISDNNTSQTIKIDVIR